MHVDDQCVFMDADSINWACQVCMNDDELYEYEGIHNCAYNFRFLTRIIHTYLPTYVYVHIYECVYIYMFINEVHKRIHILLIYVCTNIVDHMYIFIQKYMYAYNSICTYV
jgi:hypothetical protein